MRLYLSSFRLGDCPEVMLDLLGGRTRIAVILNADDYKENASREASLRRECEDLVGLGLQPSELDLRDFFGRPVELRTHLDGFDGLWVRGGNPFILRRALRASGADKAILDLLSEDSTVYGGYSAGSCMMSPSLRSLDLVDDPSLIPAGYSAEVVWDGMGVLPYCLLPHFKSDHPESAAIDESVGFLIENRIPFVVLRDGEALVREGDEYRIVGLQT